MDLARRLLPGNIEKLTLVYDHMRQHSRRAFLTNSAAAVVGVHALGSYADTNVNEGTGMQRFERELIDTHFANPGDVQPDFIGQVALGESFVIETKNANAANGPVEIEGVKAGEPIAIRIEDIEILDPIMAPNGGPLDGLPGFRLELKDGMLHFPKYFKLKPRPTLGNVAVLPKITDALRRRAEVEARDFSGWRRMVNDPRGKHCHQDCPWLGPGSRIHMNAQVDGAGVCVADFHVYMGEGETAFNGVSSPANVRMRVERSAGWLVDWPIVETEDEILICVSGDKYVTIVVEAFRACREVVAKRAGCTEKEANPIIASAMNLRNCAIYGLGDGYLPGTEGQPSKSLSVVAAISKDVFV